MMTDYVQEHFKSKLFNYQKQIIYHILSDKHRKISCRASTRCGKSYAVAVGAILYALFKPNSKVGIIAPSKDKTKIIMTYIQEFLSRSDLEPAIDLDVMGLSRIERLKREVSKSKITFKTGSYIEVRTADIKGRGFSVMGFGYNLTIIDETAEISEEVWSKIYRMLVDDPKAKILEIGNPWFLNHFYEHSLDPDWSVIHIPWQKAVEEGRMTYEDIQDQKKNLTEAEFTVLFEAEFPREITNSLFVYEDLKEAVRAVPKLKEKEEIRLGIDVARMGDDSTVIYQINRVGSLFVIKRMWEYKKLKLTETAGRIIQIIEELSPNVINMDSTGLGAGLDDMLQDYIDNNSLSIEFNSIIFSEKADDSHNINRKSDIYFNLAKIFREHQIIINEDNSLFLQLRKIMFEITSNGKKKIDDGQAKSPDRADALAIGCYVTGENIIIDFG